MYVTRQGLRALFCFALVVAPGILYAIAMEDFTIKQETKNWIQKFKESRYAKYVVAGVIVVAILAGAAYAAFFRDTAPNTNVAVNHGAAKKKGDCDEGQARGQLSGQCVDEARATRRPLAMMIENHPDARPQSGLDKADVVFEAIAEGGITRFMAAFQSQDIPEQMGPIRSARPYFADWARELDGVYGHVGGSPDGLDEIGRIGLDDANQFFNGQFYWRASNRFAPHNVYTKTENMYQLIDLRKFRTTGQPEVWQFNIPKEFTEVKDKRDATTIVADFSSPDYKVTWQYDPEKNGYKRVQNTTPFIDLVTKVQIEAKNVVVMFARQGLVSGDDHGRRFLDTTQGGKATVFMGGKATSATWKKEGIEKRTRFYDESGAEIKFNPGNTWIEVLPDESQRLSYE